MKKYDQKRRMGKKGNILLDLLSAPVILIVVLFSLFTAFYTYHKLDDETTLFKSEADGGSRYQGEIGTWMDVFTGMFPYIFVMTLASVIVLLLLSSYFIENNIVFLVVGILILMITILISVPLSNGYEEFRQELEFSETNSNFLIPNAIMDNLPFVIFFIGGVFLIILFGKRTDGGGAYA